MQLMHFRVWNYRNIIDSGDIEVGKITAFVGQNEAGKSNLFEALCCINSFVPTDAYNINEDWPVDDWGNKDPSALVCQAKFALTPEERADLYKVAGIVHSSPEASPTPPDEPPAEGAAAPAPAPPKPMPPIPDDITVLAQRSYSGPTTIEITGPKPGDVDPAKADDWVKRTMPKFVYIRDYELSGAQIELNHLAEKIKTQPDQLTRDEQTIRIILDLANIDIADFVAKGNSPEGRTIRSFDKRAASAYLSKQFRDLWRQKKVDFDIEIDATTLNIFARDEAVGMPVRLQRRSSGFRWHVSFAWKFTQGHRLQRRSCGSQKSCQDVF